MTAAAAQASELLARRRLRRLLAHGPRCPDCAGPLVFGEGCQLCPVCGFSACIGGRLPSTAGIDRFEQAS